MAFPIALQVYSVREEAKADLYGTLKQVREMGYEGVELAGLYGHTASEVAGICGELGLTPISAHVPYLDMIADPEGVLGTYAEIGCRYVAIPHLSGDLRPGKEGFADVIKNAGMLGGVAKRLGMQLLYHNHDFEFIKLNGEYGLDLLYRSVPAELLATELDVCWVKVGGEDPADFVRKYAGRAPVVHLKDYYGEKSEDMYELIGIENKAPKRPSGFEFRPLGKGLQDIPSILAAATDAGSEWLVVEQDKPSLGLSPLECARASIEYLKTVNV